MEINNNKFLHQLKSTAAMRDDLKSKNLVVAMLLALLLGGFGAHKLYLGHKWEGLGYLLFSWTLLPVVFSIIDLFFIPGQIRLANYQAQRQRLQQTGKTTQDNVDGMVIEELVAQGRHLEIVLKIIFGILSAWLIYVIGASYLHKYKAHQTPQQIFTHQAAEH